MLDSVYHEALRFITNFKALTHYGILYDQVGCSALLRLRHNYYYILIFKAILGLCPSY